MDAQRDLVEPESVGTSSGRMQRIGLAMERYVESDEIAGIVTLVARRGEIVHRTRHGWRDREAGVTMTDDTIFLGLVQPGFGFGLGSRVMLDVGAHAGPGSVGEFGWAGAAKTYFWIDPVEELVGVMMARYMTGVEPADQAFRSVVYQALDE